MKQPTIIAFTTLLCLSVASLAPGQDAGKKVYEQNCAVCHGSNGDGQGPAAYLLYPRPRDFTKGTYKFRSTPSGSIPTDADLDRTIRNGLVGTAMPSWKTLSAGDIKAVMAYVKGFAPDAFKTSAEPIRVGDAPKVTPQLLTQGKEQYAKMGCANCHGEKGTGDGPSAKTLMDSYGFPIRPFDFTRAGAMKGGATLADIYRTFTTGVDGTPMPSYADSLPDADRWALAAYVDSLGDKRTTPPPPIADRIAITKSKELAAAPDDPKWKASPATMVPLRPTYALSQSVDRVSVKAMSDGAKIAFLLEWADPLPNDTTLTVDAFRDGAAIQFPMKPVPEGESIFFGMGQKNLATNIWHWKSDWQGDVKKVADIASAHPNMAVDIYPQNVSEAATDAGNLMPIQKRTSPVEDLNATGFSTLTSQPTAEQNVDGKGIYADGKWHVLFTRALKSPDANDVPLTGDTQVAFAIWNGSSGDRNGQKAVSEWVKISLR